MPEGDEEAPETQTELPVAQETTEEPEDDVLDGTGKEMQDRLSLAQTAAEKLGVVEWAKEKTVAVLKDHALSIYREAQEKPSSRYGKLLAVWNELTDEGREEFLNNHTFLKDMAWGAVTPIAVSVPQSMYRFFKRNTLPASWLDLKDFNDPQEVRKLIALGVLEYPEEKVLKIDQDANHTLKVFKVLAPLAVLIPEAGPAIAEGIEEGAGIAAPVAQLAEQILPKVRVEVRKEIQTIAVARKEKHDEVATADGPEGVMPHATVNE